MSMDHSQHIEHLREAAARRDWNSCRASVRKLLPQFEQKDTLPIFLNLIRRFLADLASAYSQDEEILQLADLLTNISSYEILGERGQKIDVVLEKKFTEPGINNARNALRKLSRLQTTGYPSEEYLDIWIDILSGLIMGILSHNWGQTHQDLWQQWFNQETKNKFFILAQHFWSHPETIALNKLLWNKIADDFKAVP